MKKFTKKIVATLLAAVMVLAMGVTVFAAEDAVTSGSYTVSATLFKEAECTNTSMGNSGIDYIEAYYNSENNTVDIVLVTKTVFYNNETGQLNSFGLYAGEKLYEAEKDGLTFTISGFPADQFQVGSVLQGQFESYVSIMGTRTGYLKITALTAME